MGDRRYMQMKRKWLVGIMSAVLMVCGFGIGTEAAFEPNVEAAYNTAVQGQDALDGLDVTVQEKTVSASTNVSSEKHVTLHISGIKSTVMQADICIDTEEGDMESYYRDGYYYTTTSEGKKKLEMERSDIWSLINSHIYMDMTSNCLKMLSSQTDSQGNITYWFAATEDTLGDYSKRLLEGAGDDQGLVIDSLHGTMLVDAEGHIQTRNLQLVYTVSSNDKSETFFTQSEAVFHSSGEPSDVTIADLSDYKELQSEKPVETITPIVQTVYTTDDVNVRAAGNLSAVILGGLNAGSGVTETGYTSDGWIQIQYNGTTGYVWSEYISTKKPVLTKKGSGTMYATAGVNIRESYSSDSPIMGVLLKGQGVEITGTTDNGWVRVKYNGTEGYVYAEYLSWSEPVVDHYVENGYISGFVTDASYGSLTIMREDGQGNVMFNTVYAEMNLKDTICSGDWVEVFYHGAGTPYTASKVNNYTRHNDYSEEKKASASGTIVKLTPSRMEVSCTDGVYRTFDISETEFKENIVVYEGKYVTVSWMSDRNGADKWSIEALLVEGE